MPSVYRSPAALAQALLSKPVSPARIRKALWHAAKGTEAEFRATLAAIPDAAVRAEVEHAGARARFAG